MLLVAVFYIVIGDGGFEVFNPQLFYSNPVIVSIVVFN